MSSQIHVPVNVPVGKIEHAIHGQLKDLQGEGERPVQRVRMSNLVIYCVGQTSVMNEIRLGVSDIVAVHPARVLFLGGDPKSDKEDISATVQVQAHSLGKHQQACSEFVFLNATGQAVDRLPFAVRALVIGDLPTNLWWAVPQPPALAGVLMYELAENAQQIMYDSIGWTEPAKGVAATASWLDSVERTEAGKWRVASDLNWRRLKYWRRLLGQSLDQASAPGAEESVTELSLEHGPHAVVQGYELVGWLVSRLGWQLKGGKAQGGKETVWRFASPAGETTARVKRLDEGAPAIHRIRITCKINGTPVKMNLAADSDSRLSVVLEGMDAQPRTVTVPPQNAAELIGRQLSDREKDPVFKQSMAVAQQLAKAVMG